MKNINPFLILFLALPCFIHAQSLVFDYQVVWPTSVPDYYLDGNIYSVGGEYSWVISLSTGKVDFLDSLVKACNSGSSDFIITPSGGFYCFPEGNNPTTTFNLIQFSPSNYSELNSFNFKCGIYTFYTQTDNFISYITRNSQQTTFQVNTFDTLNDQYICQSSSTAKIAEYFDYFVGSGLLYQINNNDQSINFVPCGSQTTITTSFTSPSKAGNWILITQNQSSVFVMTWGSPDGNSNFAQSGMLDITGRVHLGQIYPYYPMKFNDTHFMSVFIENGYWQLGLFTVTPNLNIYTVAQINTFVLGSYYQLQYQVSAVPGGPCLAYGAFSDISGFSYNFDEGSYQNTFPDFPPITLSNGSVVNLTVFGYFIQSPGEPTFFVNIPYNSLYQDSSNLGIIWTLFVPGNAGSNYGYKSCVLLEINTINSQILTTNYSKCPSFNGEGYMSSVSFDSNNNPVVAYVQGNLYMIQLSGYQQVMDLNGYSSVQAALNLASGSGVFTGIQNDHFEIANFILSSGKIVNSTAFPPGQGIGPGNFVQLLTGATGRYYLLGSSSSDQSNFTIWDSMNQESVSGMTTNICFYFTERTPNGEIIVNFPILALDIDPADPNVLGSVAVGGYGEINLIRLNGNTQTYSVPNQNVYQINQTNEDSIWVMSQGTFASSWGYYDLIYE